MWELARGTTRGWGLVDARLRHFDFLPFDLTSFHFKLFDRCLLSLFLSDTPFPIYIYYTIITTAIKQIQCIELAHTIVADKNIRQQQKKTGQTDGRASGQNRASV